MGSGCIVVALCSNFKGIIVNQDEGIFVRKFQSFKRVVFRKFVVTKSNCHS